MDLNMFCSHCRNFFYLKISWLIYFYTGVLKIDLKLIRNPIFLEITFICFIFIYVYTYVYTHVCMYTQCTYVCMYKHKHIYMHVCIYMWINIHMHGCIYTCMCVYTYVYICINIHACTCIHYVYTCININIGRIVSFYQRASYTFIWVFLLVSSGAFRSIHLNFFLGL